MSLDIFALVKQAQAGDAQAFEVLVERSHLRLRKVAISLVPAWAVEDVLQETYLTAYRKLACLREPDAFLSWLTRIALHNCHNWQRSDSKLVRTSEDCLSEVVAPEALDVTELRQELATLSRNDRNILILREYLELSYEEIGEILDLSVGSVKSRLYYARKRFLEAHRL